MLFSATAGPARRQVREVAAHPLDQALRDRDHGRSASPASGAATSTLLFAALALMGVHSTLFGPVKYAILPQHAEARGAGRRQRPGRDGHVRRDPARHDRRRPRRRDRAAAGPMLAGARRDRDRGRRLAREPRDSRTTPAVAPELAINWNPFTETWRTSASRTATASCGCRCSASRGSGSTARSSSRSSPASRATSLGGDEHVVTFLLALFSVGIGVGSLLCERLSGRKVELGLVPFGSIGLTLFAIDLWLASRNLHATGARRARRVPRAAARTGASPPTSC